MLEHVNDPCVVIVADDVPHVYAQTDFHKRRIEDADTARALVERLAILAQDAGARVFDFNKAARPMSSANCRPLSVDTWGGGVIGSIGHYTRFDASLLPCADINFYRDRIVLADGR